ncbi:MAG: hypothetical protein JWM19_930 [Actinomycetia bacterium]|nr:hypothetical protein [Actinomycetes bacterium]
MSCPVAAAPLECEVHGRMSPRDDGRWECAGFDGEGCLNIPGGIPADAAMRLASGQTYWAGVNVNGVSWLDRRARSRATAGPEEAACQP